MNVLAVIGVNGEIDRAAAAVAADMLAYPPSASDGIWRFDKIIEKILVSPKTKEEWLIVYKIALGANLNRDTWDRSGYGIVVNYAQTRAAYATPGFAEARSKWMS